MIMANRLLVEISAPCDGEERPARSRPGGKALPKKGAARGRDRPRSVIVNRAESPLGWLKARGLVSERQYAAGDTLRGDWELAALGGSVTMRWGGAPPAKTARGAPRAGDPTLVQIAAKARFEAAAAAVGTGLSDLLWRVVCAGEGMRDAERALGWPARAGKVVLNLALDRLADHYRLR
jgi:Domain of unknown function (DUF6456)